MRQGRTPRRHMCHRTMFRSERRKIIDLLGSKCVECGFSDWRALQIDHVESLAHSGRERLTSLKLYKDIRRCIELNINRYQLLCANCNWIKRYEKDENVGTRKVSADLSSGDSVQQMNTNIN